MDVLVAFHDKLVRPCDLLQLILVKEFVGNVCSPGPPGPSRAHAPAHLRLVGVAPKQIAHGAVVRHVLEPVQLLDLLNGLDCRREPAVGAKNLPFYDGGQGQVAEDICKVLPSELVAVFAETLVIKSVYLVNFAIFMVP